MPQISTPKIDQVSMTDADNKVEVLNRLKNMTNCLENEICQALLEGDVKRAERLVSVQISVRKVSNCI